jgi:hypothetical protein
VHFLEIRDAHCFLYDADFSAVRFAKLNPRTHVIPSTLGRAWEPKLSLDNSKNSQRSPRLSMVTLKFDESTISN